MDLAAWRDLSIIWLAFLAFIIGIVPAVLLYFVVRGMMVVNRSVLRYLKLGQYYSGIARDQTRKYSLLLAEPVTRVHGQAARVQTVIQSLTPHSNHPEQKELQP
jgi:hypothetical protein